MRRLTVARLLALVSLALAVSSIAGCILSWPFRETDPRGLAVSFSHKTHAEEELSCEDCHRGFEQGDEAGMPGGLRACNLCHEDIDSEKSEERRLEVYLGADGKPWWSGVTALSSELRFSHRSHHEADVSCEQCHEGIESSEAVDSRLRVTKDDCYECHAEQASSCEYCHTEIRKDREPENHRKDWTRMHGIVVRNSMHERSSDRCGLCHQEQECADCHQVELPRNHTNQWRLRTHGIAAAIDRERCTSCHQTDICQQCHSSTPPRSHRGGFGSTQNRHCIQCHDPVSGQSCFTCHQGTPSHAAATPLPGNAAHLTATESACRSCHVPLKIDHPDNGDSCRGCHR